MGSLSNLYISQSYQGLLTFSTNSGSTSTLTQISDGIGNGLGLYLNNSGSASLNGNLTIGGNLIVSGAFDIEGAIVIRDNVYVTGSIYSSADISSSRMLAGQMTASNAFITNDLNVGGTLFANKVVTLIESSSIIFSSGSNILGDSVLDTQTLNGTIIMSGSSQLTGSMQVSADISSSTLNGMGNVTVFSQSVDYRLDNLETYSGSAEQKFAAIQTYTSSMNVYTASVNNQLFTLQQFTASVGLVTTASYNAYTTSTNARLDSIEIATSSLQIFSASAKIQLANLELTTASLNSSVSNLNLFTASNGIASLNTYTSSNNTKWTTLGNLTGSYATTGSNTFVANQIISGSLRANVGTLTIAGGTANMDCSLGNFFTLNLPSSSTTALTATNIQPGQTISLKIKQLATSGATTGSLTYPTYIKFPQYGNYNPSPFSGAVDVLSFVAFDTTTLYAVNVRNMNY
jgi:hypothetical protein